jgi:hypothetical protein
MPVTPFHVGPAIVVKALGPRWFSLGVFTLVQVAIDVESVVNIALGRYPVHAALHTVAGSLAVAAVLVMPARYWLPLVYAWIARVPDLAWLRSRLASGHPIPWTAAITGAVFGALSHVVLDALMHPDVNALAPWRQGNPMFIPGSFIAIHVGCLLLGVIGAVALGLRVAGPGWPRQDSPGRPDQGEGHNARTWRSDRSKINPPPPRSR